MLLMMLVLFGALLLLLGSGVWVAFSLMALGWLGLSQFTSIPTGDVMASDIWGSSYSWELTALPMFIWMGEILFRSRLADDMFSGLSPWMQRIPGRLLHTNVVGSGLFAAVSGSSAATCATMGKMTIPELTKRGYDESVVIGTLAGSATLGLLIPPSIILIVYGVATDQSISRLFMAGILPGLMLISLFALYLMLWAWRYPDRVPPGEERLPLVEKLRRARRLIPLLGLIVGVIGSIYAGLASPTEAAAVGVVLSLLLARFQGTMTRRVFSDALLGAVRTSTMIAFILAGASFLTAAMGFTGLPRDLAAWIGTLELSPWMLLAALTLLFILLGCFLDGISVVVLTTSIMLPMVEAAGIDLIWFGIFLVIVVEMSQITPPVGFNLFVLQGMTGRNILSIAWAALPFFFLMLLGVVLISLFPEIVTYLPTAMNK
ncbi:MULTISPECIES: TRAP transporter large permease subunit [unclassified Halomonas]|uniref:TRAP transporter large permease n=1 Tax=unclassified Halomonas TaxID=2609666 RepID=UPI0028876882|nr:MULTISPECIES: TRAP transporter large permease subunit [unclassified Halomonas]MDT0500435.1 TRAP transporter large permease subunit [Halomonas sp. PAR7]MDT0511668.1 TRAP transporter large permease subunit [Halomonas sp. LES1]MDT0590044.1 TRAP transporter large permease subunit [Halomonas sp. PAR8]